ncbi:MAG: SCP2 sterol-binding domain-containing protein [Pseudomonadota bacterium]
MISVSELIIQVKTLTRRLVGLCRAPFFAHMNVPMKCVIQFNFSGDVQGACHFPIENGKISAIHGAAESPDLTIESPFDVWMDIMTGKADGQQMFMAQRYKVKGDLSLLMRMNQIFRKQG